MCMCACEFYSCNIYVYIFCMRCTDEAQKAETLGWLHPSVYSYNITNNFLEIIYLQDNLSFKSRHIHTYCTHPYIIFQDLQDLHQFRTLNIISSLIQYPLSCFNQYQVNGSSAVLRHHGYHNNMTSINNIIPNNLPQIVNNVHRYVCYTIYIIGK